MCPLPRAHRQRAYERTSEVETLWAHLYEPPPRLHDAAPDLPAALGDVLARALAKEPAERQQTADELAREALAAV
jgi:hypothetical protein